MAARRSFDCLSYDELRCVIDYLEGVSLCALSESCVVCSPLSGLVRQWSARWRRLKAIERSVPFLDLADVGTLVASYFIADVRVACAAHAGIQTQLLLAPTQRRRRREQSSFF